jgi:predicted transcriptional regulator
MPRMSVVVSDETNEAIKRLARADRRSASEYIARLIQAHVERKKEKAE